jgi:hypothetical protein
LGESFPHCETDIVIFIQNVDELPNERTGDYLGHLTDELEEFSTFLTLKNLCRVDLKTMRFLFSALRQENVRLNVS